MILRWSLHSSCKSQQDELQCHGWDKQEKLDGYLISYRFLGTIPFGLEEIEDCPYKKAINFYFIFSIITVFCLLCITAILILLCFIMLFSLLMCHCYRLPWWLIVLVMGVGMFRSGKPLHSIWTQLSAFSEYGTLELLRWNIKRERLFCYNPYPDNELHTSIARRV